jgi:hypothetical protein
LKYSGEAEQLKTLTTQDEPFVWELEQQLASETMKTAISTAPALQHFDPEKEVIIETDVSDYVSVRVLSERDDHGVLHPVANFSKKHTPAECNYDIYDKELMVTIKALEEWGPECEGATYPLQFITDHKNHKHFMTKNLLNRREAPSSEFLTHLEYQIIHPPGKFNGNADALTRRPGDLPEWGDERLINMEQVVLQPQNLPEQLRLLADGLIAQSRPCMTDDFNNTYETDPLPGEILSAIRTNGSLQGTTIGECIQQNGRNQY